MDGELGTAQNERKRNRFKYVETIWHSSKNFGNLVLTLFSICDGVSFSSVIEGFLERRQNTNLMIELDFVLCF